MSSTRFTTATLVLVAVTASSAWSQQRTGSGTGMAFGNTGLGNTGTGTGFGSNSSAFGNSNVVGQSNTLGGQANIGSGLFGSGLTSNGLGSSNPLTPGVANPYGFIGASGQAGTFVGAAAQQQNLGVGGAGGNQFGQNQFGQGQNRFGQNRFGQNQFGNQGQRGQFGQFGMGSTANVTLRTRLAVGFDYPAIRVPQVATNLQTQLARLSQVREGLGSITVTVDGSTAVLTGTVPSERDRDLAMRLARLEPGISAVTSELVIEPEGDEDSAAGSAESETVPLD